MCLLDEEAALLFPRQATVLPGQIGRGCDDAAGMPEQTKRTAPPQYAKQQQLVPRGILYPLSRMSVRAPSLSTVTRARVSRTDAFCRGLCDMGTIFAPLPHKTAVGGKPDGNALTRHLQHLGSNQFRLLSKSSPARPPSNESTSREHAYFACRAGSQSFSCNR